MTDQTIATLPATDQATFSRTGFCSVPSALWR